MSVPLEITIFPTGKIAALDHTLLPTMEGTVKMERTSVIEFRCDSRRFVIYMVKAAKYVCYWHLKEIESWWNISEVSDKIWKIYQSIKIVDDFKAGFESYEDAVDFENVIIPFLRNRDGYEEY